MGAHIKGMETKVIKLTNHFSTMQSKTMATKLMRHANNTHLTC